MNIFDLENLSVLDPSDLAFWVMIAFYCALGIALGKILSRFIDWLGKDEHDHDRH